ncbi:tripartite tricarboxylate transporter TctB family protein [Humitalea rosea]|uniref:Tripartite tricarboxylate transporter TctB family protein n=1 Tax=Humitalea rosea TaxID=990373 RepID=A0A2W7IR44_9PROT|nr:tripartite tricarboxylate transporter TctB family protein [Humitalea rosea]PZW48441.1 tripartite tricarboxylate transporter TctB family protein [Humitalea rosea]
MKINAKDAVSACILILLALVGLWLNQEHNLGTARRMGPGYMPMLTFVILLVIGVIVLGLSMFSGPDPLESWAFRELILILISMVVFGLLLEQAGLFITIGATVGVAALADRTHKPLGVVGCAVALMAICWWVFIYELDIRVPIWPQF